MKADISVSMITKNAKDTVEKSLLSIKSWVKEIVIVDSFSTDNTLDIAKRYKVKIYKHRYNGEGSQRSFALKKSKARWILAIDADEVISSRLKKEILKSIKNPIYSGFKIPVQSHFKNKPLNYGGENYHKMILFRKDKGFSTNDEIHAVYKVTDNNVGTLKNKLDHYSYRSLIQLFSKFTGYAIREAKKKKSLGERTSLRKILFYPPHLFWARFVKDKGYKDGFSRLPVDIAFFYLEFLTYTLMLWI